MKPADLSNQKITTFDELYRDIEETCDPNQEITVVAVDETNVVWQIPEYASRSVQKCAARFIPQILADQSGIVDSLQQDNAGLQAELASTLAALASALEEVTLLQEQLSNLQGEMTALQNEIALKQAQIEALQARADNDGASLSRLRADKSSLAAELLEIKTRYEDLQINYASLQKKATANACAAVKCHRHFQEGPDYPITVVVQPQRPAAAPGEF